MESRQASVLIAQGSGGGEVGEFPVPLPLPPPDGIDTSFSPLAAACTDATRSALSRRRRCRFRFLFRPPRRPATYSSPPPLLASRSRLPSNKMPLALSASPDTTSSPPLSVLDAQLEGVLASPSSTPPYFAFVCLCKRLPHLSKEAYVEHYRKVRILPLCLYPIMPPDLFFPAADPLQSRYSNAWAGQVPSAVDTNCTPPRQPCHARTLRQRLAVCL